MAYSAVDTFDLSAPQRMTIKVRRRGVKTPTKGGVVKRRQTFSSESVQGQAGVRVFEIGYTLATKDDYNKAVALWKNTTGGSQGISFTNTYSPYTGSSETLIVRMLSAPFQVRKVSETVYQFSIELEEMLHAPGV